MSELGFVFILTIIPIVLIAGGLLVYQYFLTAKRNKIIKLFNEHSDSILESNKHTHILEKDDSFWLTKQLAYAGFAMQNATTIFMISCLTFGFGFGILFFILTGNIIISSVTSIVFSILPYLLIKNLISKRQTEFNTGLKNIIDKVTSMMRSGVGFEHAIYKSVTTSKSEFTRKTFNIYLSEKDIIGEDRAFLKMFKVVDSKEFRIFYLVLSIGKNSGGKFSNTLDKLRKTLHAQHEITQEIISSTKEIKIGSYMIIALVIFIYKMLDSSLQGVLNEHFFGSEEGQVQMFFIVLWVALGIFINSLVSKIKV